MKAEKAECRQCYLLVTLWGLEAAGCWFLGDILMLGLYCSGTESDEAFTRTRRKIFGIDFGFNVSKGNNSVR